MRNLRLAALTLLFTASSLYSDDELLIRYQDPSDLLALTLSQDISVPQNPSIASRNLSFELALATDDLPEVTVTINAAKGTYTAHGMKQRLGTRHLTGTSFPLAIGEDGRQLQLGASQTGPELHLGAPIERSLSIAEALTDMLPLLPTEVVTLGAEWSTSRPIRTLEGWTWGTGLLSSKHRVTGIDRRGAQTVISVETAATATLGPIDGQRGYSGELKRSLTWTFDATAGRLLSLSMEQETQGLSSVPQGKVDVHQLTHVELAPAS